MNSTVENSRLLLVFLLTSIILSILSWTAMPVLKDFYANSNSWLGMHSIIELILNPFLHISALHLFWNMLILTFLWANFTSSISAKQILPFFVFIETIQYIVILSFNQPPTAGISGFVFGIFGYMLISYIRQKNPEYKGILFFAFLSFILSSHQDPETQVRTSSLGHVSGFTLWIIWAVAEALVKKVASGMKKE